jgi:hypothetical protein
MLTFSVALIARGRDIKGFRRRVDKLRHRVYSSIQISGYCRVRSPSYISMYDCQRYSTDYIFFLQVCMYLLPLQIRG